MFVIKRDEGGSNTPIHHTYVVGSGERDREAGPRPGVESKILKSFCFGSVFYIIHILIYFDAYI